MKPTAPFERLAFGLALTVLLATPACLPQLEIELDGETEFSTERLRPSLEPYFGTQPGIPEFYSDGDFYDPDAGYALSDVGSQRLSELTIADIPGDRLAQLHRSHCFWAFEGDTPAVSYELLLKDVPYEEERIPEVSVCGGVGVNVPDTRRNFRDVDVADGAALPGFEVQLVGFEGGSADPERPCEIPIDVDGDGHTDAGDPDFNPFQANAMTTFAMSHATPLRSDDLSHLPVCSIRTAVPPVTTDTSFLLELETANTGEVLVVTPEGQEIRRAGGGSMIDRPKLLEPRIQVVDRPRAPGDIFSIVRPLSFDSELPEVQGDKTTERQYWRWAVPIGRDGVWHENFSYLLAVNRVRIFQYGENEDRNGNFERVYLSPKRITAFAGEDRDASLLNCKPVSDGEALPLECRDVFGFTPTYAHAHPTEWITWVVQFRRVTRDRPCLPSEGPGICSDVVEDTTVDPSDEVFVEFDLVGPEFGSQGSALTVSPATGGAFGNIVISESPILEDAFALENVGRASVTVEDMWIDGRDAGVFSFRVEGGLAPPFVLPGDRAVGVSLQASAVSWGEKRARLYVRARDVFGMTTTLDVPISGNAVDWVLDALPSSFWLTRDAQGYTTEADYVRSLFYGNVGVLPLPRGEIEIRGPDPEAFSVVMAETDDPFYDPVVHGEPPPRFRSIRPGEDEWLLVVYHPQDSWRPIGSPPDVAEIHVTVGDQVHVTPVQAMCDGACWFAPPQPAGGGSGGGGPTVGGSPVATTTRR